MHHFLIWPMLVILAGATASIPAVQNSTTRNVLYWFVLSPLAFGLVSVIWLAGIR